MDGRRGGGRPELAGGRYHKPAPADVQPSAPEVEHATQASKTQLNEALRAAVLKRPASLRAAGLQRPAVSSDPPAKRTRVQSKTRAIE